MSNNEDLPLIDTDKIVKNQETDIVEENKDLSYCSWLNLPKAVYFIIITELCERFTYYGMRSILILYLTQHLLLKEWNAVSLFHFFACICYLTTIFGCFISDNYLGKYKTMLILGTVYTVGSTLMSLTALPERNLAGPLVSLILIGFGTGGVKACVAPFGGDQINRNEKSMLGSYFSMFYFSINLGALLSTIISPILRANVACNGSQDCYPLAFGVPAILMGAAMIIFLVGHRYYVEVAVSTNIYMKATGCVSTAIKLWYRDRSAAPKKRLLDYASPEYDDKIIDDLRTLANIIILFLPLPIYWALFEQMGSRWTLQATLLDGEVFPNFIILPDQMFIVNVLFVVILIVLFDYCIYPIVSKLDLTSRPLQKMTIAITFTCLAFIITFFLQRYIEDIQPPKISPTNSRLVIANGQACGTTIAIQDGRTLQANGYRTSALYLDIPYGVQQIQVSVSSCRTMTNPISLNTSVILIPGQINFLIIDPSASNTIAARLFPDSHSPNIKGYPLVKLVIYSTTFDKYQFRIKHSSNGKTEKQFTVSNNNSFYTSDWNTLTTPGRYLWDFLMPQSANSSGQNTWTAIMISKSLARPTINPIKITSSEVALFYITYSYSMNSVITIPLVINEGARLSILWQVPQYFLMSIGEVLFNVPGLTFSYSQAPVGMKSLVNSLWYLCDAFGNIIVMGVARMHFFERQSFEYLTFAIVCAVFNIIFAGLARWYPFHHTDQYIEIT